MKNKEHNRIAWEKLESADVILATPVFEIKKQRLRCMRTGQEGDFFTMNCNDWINIIAITPDNRLVMIRQHRAGTDQIELEIPGGGIDKSDKNPIEAGARELLEETGFAGKHGKIIGKVCPNPALQGNTCYTVMFKDSEQISDPTMEGTEDIETILVPVSEVDAKIRSGEIFHGLVLNAIHFMEKEMNL